MQNGRNESVPVPFIEDAVFSLVYFFEFFFKKQLSIGMWTYVWIFSWNPLISVSGFIPIPYCFYDSSSVIRYGIVTPPALVILSRIVFAVLALCSHMK